MQQTALRDLEAGNVAAPGTIGLAPVLASMLERQRREDVFREIFPSIARALEAPPS